MKPYTSPQLGTTCLLAPRQRRVTGRIRADPGQSRRVQPGRPGRPGARCKPVCAAVVYATVCATVVYATVCATVVYATVCAAVVYATVCAAVVYATVCAAVVYATVCAAVVYATVCAAVVYATVCAAVVYATVCAAVVYATVCAAVVYATVCAAVVYATVRATQGQAVMTPEMLEEVRQVMPRIEAERLYRGKGGDKLRIAVCRLLQCMAEARFPLPKTSQYARAVSSIGRGPVKRERTLAKYQESLEGHIGNFSPQVQKAAVAAFRAFAQHYYTAWDPDLHPAILKRLQVVWGWRCAWRARSPPLALRYALRPLIPVEKWGKGGEDVSFFWNTEWNKCDRPRPKGGIWWPSVLMGHRGGYAGRWPELNWGGNGGKCGKDVGKMGANSGRSWGYIGVHDG